MAHIRRPFPSQLPITGKTSAHPHSRNPRVVYKTEHTVFPIEGSAAAGVAAMLNRSLTVTQTKYANQKAYNEKAHAHIPFRFVRYFTRPLSAPKLIQIESTTN